MTCYGAGTSCYGFGRLAMPFGRFAMGFPRLAACLGGQKETLGQAVPSHAGRPGGRGAGIGRQSSCA
jgi:hypothetical protein